MFLVFRTGAEEITDSIVLDEDERRHVRARRLSSGQSVHVGDGRSRRWPAVLESPERIRIVGDPVEREEPERVVYTALPDGGRLDWLIQKAAELGATCIQPIVFERSSRREFSAARSRRIALSAAAQAGRFRVPDVLDALPFEHMAESARGRRPVVLERESDRKTPPGGADGIVVGPEGGFVDAERSIFVRLGWPSVRVGAHILRVETAVIAGLVLLGVARES